MAERVIVLALDAENKQILAQVTDDAGAVVAAWGSVRLTLGKHPGGTPTDPGTNLGMEIKFRETIGCDPATGEPRYAIFLRSAWSETQSTADPET